MPLKGTKFGSAPIQQGGRDPKPGGKRGQNWKRQPGDQGRLQSHRQFTPGMPMPTERGEGESPGNWGGNVMPGQQGIQSVPRAPKANVNRPGASTSVGRDAINKSGGAGDMLAHTTEEFQPGSHTDRHLAEVRKHLVGTKGKAGVSHSQADIKQDSDDAEDY